MSAPIPRIRRSAGVVFKICLAREKRTECAFRAFFSGLPCVASACSVFGIAAGSPPSLYDGDLLRPHRSELAAGSPPSLYDGDRLRPHRAPYYLRACSSGNLIEKRSKRRPVYSKAPLIQLKTQKFEPIFES